MWGRGVPEFEFSSSESDGTLVVSMVGDLDIVTSRQLDDVLADSRARIARVVLDLSAVDFLDTRSLALAGARFQYTRTLWITGLADRIPMYDTVEQAIAAQQAATEEAS